MASTVAWLNFDAEQQRRTELMMAAIAEQGTIDSLGLGNIRDLIAGALHPGITVLQTRARYLVFLPNIYRSLRGSTTDALWSDGRRGEGKLADDLNAFYRAHPGEDDRGVIGRNRGDAAKQPASVAYWGLLRQLGILRLPNASVSDYCDALLTNRQNVSAASGFNDEDLSSQTPTSFWSEFPTPDPRATGFDLPRSEAEWLQERFVVAGRQYAEADQPLWAHLMRADQQTWCPDVEFPWEHPDASAFPSNTRQPMLLGRDLDRTIHGARVLYNYLCSVGQSQDHPRREEWVDFYSAEMQKWQDEVSDGLPPVGRLDELADWADRQLVDRGSALAQHRARMTMQFVKQWHALATTSDDLLTDPRAAQLVRRRESSIKPGRARLTNRDRLREYQGVAGYGRFSYNWRITNRLLTDVHRGLGTEFVRDGAA